MTHHTQINKETSPTFETILNVGRTNDGDIYIDVRVYDKGDVVEVGDIAVSQDEWDEINDNLNKKDERLYVCPVCGDIVSETYILESLTTGGYGMCMCKFGNGQRVLVRYEPYKDDIGSTATEARLMRVIRTLSG